MKDQHLISVDELRAAGALEVPEGWRDSLKVERTVYLLPGFADEPEDTEEEPTQEIAKSDVVVHTKKPRAKV